MVAPWSRVSSTQRRAMGWISPSPLRAMARPCWGRRFPQLYQPLAERFHLVWYDFRGTGLSAREAIDFSMDAMIRDVEAVVEAAGLTGFAMVAYYGGVPIAVTYAAIHPENISSLVLADGWVKSSDWNQSPAFVALEALRSGDWTVYTETYARLRLGFENQEFTAKLAAYMRE